VTALGQFLTSAAAKMVFFDGTKKGHCAGLEAFNCFPGADKYVPHHARSLVELWDEMMTYHVLCHLTFTLK
jgi:hypothetical protein